MKGIILAGGLGTRLNPLTKVTNKHLLPIYNEPMIFKPIKTLRDSGIDDIVIVLGGESVGDFIRLLGSGKDLDVGLTYIFQDTPGGIADALYLTKKVVHDEKIAVILGDNIFDSNFKKEVNEFENDAKYECYLFIQEVDDPKRFGVAELDDDLKIVNIEEKPMDPKSNFAVAGLYFYDCGVYDKIDLVMKNKGCSSRGELEITDVNNVYVHEGKARTIILNGFWSDAGTFDSLLGTARYFAGKSRK
ncbi:MAG: sugar phosphate nucleotidyltransferase [Promethearchaeota archaeon]